MSFAHDVFPALSAGGDEHPFGHVRTANSNPETK